MADAISTTLLVSTIVSLMTSALGISNTFSNLAQASVVFPRKIELLRREIGVMRGVVDECFRTIDDGSIEAPPHVKDLLVATFEQGKEVERLAVKASDAAMGSSTASTARKFVSRAKSMYFILSSEKHLTSAVAILRDKVGLLRDACSEIRLRGQLVEISAAMARLIDLSMSSTARGHGTYPASFESRNPPGDDPQGNSGRATTEGGGPGYEGSDPQQMQIVKVVQDLFRRDIASWEADDYVLNGTVQVESPENRAMMLVEDATKEGGQRFNYRPARVKVDTGSAADFVSLEYLKKAGFNIASLKPIPEAEQVNVEGLNRVIYKPKYQANLQWYRQGEMEMNVTPFLVVDHGPFELLLSSRRFAEEAERRLFSLPLVRPRKTREQIEIELKEAKRKRQEAKDLEEKDMLAALARRNRETGRVSTINTTAGQVIPEPVDLEQGGAADTLPPSPNGQDTEADIRFGVRRLWPGLFWRRS